MKHRMAYKFIPIKTFEEGEVFCKWLRQRLIAKNKNVISAELGATGSGKSYRDLRKAELWYKFYFHKAFPVENICFGVTNTMNLLSSGKLKRGDVIIFEEAGVNLGSRDWQSNMSKMFNHILQSFRSMNLALFLNLPYLSMLDNQARHLIHYYAESVGIDMKEKINKCKPFFIQVAQTSGKMYKHYPKVVLNHKIVKIKRFNWSLPSKYLIKAYEKKKKEYLENLAKDYAEKLNALNVKYEKEEWRPSARQLKMYFLAQTDLKLQEIGDKFGIGRSSVCVAVKKVKNWVKEHQKDDMKGDYKG